MLNLDDITNKNNKKHNTKMVIYFEPFSQNLDNWRFWTLVLAQLNLINEQDDIDKIYLYAKDLSEPKHKFLIKKCKNAEMKHLNDPNAFIECLNTMNNVYENTDGYNPNRKKEIYCV